MKLKRILSVILTLALLGSLLVVPAFAASETVALPEDWRLTSDLDLNVPAGDTLTIDGQGKYHIYEMGGKLTNSGGGAVTFADGTILYPAAGDADAARFTANGIWDTEESNALMALRTGGYYGLKIDPNITHGTITVDKLVVKQDEPFTVTATPEAGYYLAKCDVALDTGNTLQKTHNVGGQVKISFAVSGNATIYVTFQPTPVVDPTLSPGEGTYTSAQRVTISCATEGAEIYYTTDGSAPNIEFDYPGNSRVKYTGPITISETTTLKAVAWKDNVYSSVTTATYTINTGGGSDGGSSGSGSTTTETTTNPDGSTTTTVTKPDGSTTETTKNPDGSQEVVETKKDGTVTTTTTDTDGNKTEVVEKPDGSSETTVTNKDGSTSSTTVSAAGKSETAVTLPAAVLGAAEDAGEAAALPMPPVPVVSDRDSAPLVTVDLPADRSTRVEIPVENVTPGVVAILVKDDGTEEVIKTTVETENGVAVTLTDGETVKIVDNSKDFADVSDTYWGADAVAFAASRELMGGTSDTTFAPETPMSRAMIVTVLARLEGVDTSTGDTWYDAGRDWAMAAGISDGNNMDGTLTREQLATMLYRYAGNPVVSSALTGYTDASAINSYAADAMAWAVENGIIIGTTATTLDPQGQATRAQAATVLMRFIQIIA